MIRVTKLNKEQVFVNAELVELVESNPDTSIIFQSGKRIVVRESAEEVVEKILEYKKQFFSTVAVRTVGIESPVETDLRNPPEEPD